jgi:arsenite methyltransferase
MNAHLHIHMSANNARFFKALGDETRLSLVSCLLGNERCACEFAEISNRDQTTISRHLKILTEAGIVRQEKRGRNVICSIKDESVRRRLFSMGITQSGSCCKGNRAKSKDLEGDQIKEIVRERYSRIAVEGGPNKSRALCCGNQIQDPIQISESLGYSKKELEEMPESNLGLGCGNPGALGAIKSGDVVLDLGSGAGIDAFLAAKRVGKNGKVIGVDFTKEMIAKAKKNAKKIGHTNVEFRYGDIENLPVESNSVDVVMSNCVINLVPDKSKAFREAYRVLKPGGSLYISDMVLLKELSKEQKNDKDLIAGCVGGAILRDEYLDKIREAGFRLRKIIDDKGVARRQYKGLPVESLKLVAKKRRG